jgi:hypothetical protein
VRPSRLFVLALAGIGCGSGARKEAAPEAVADDARVALPEVEPPKTPPKPDPTFPAGTRSLRLTRTVSVRIAPGDQEHQIGTIAQDTRVGWTDVEKGPGCKKAWVQIAPRGWVCGEFLEANPRPPLGVELPRLERASVVPGTYGKVVEEGAMIYGLPEAQTEKKKPDRKPGKKPEKKPAPVVDPKPAPEASPVSSPSEVDDPAVADTVVRVADPMVPVRPILGTVNVRKYGEVAYGDVVYWKISRGNEYVPVKSIRQHDPSEYHGVRLGDDTGWTLPMAFIWPKAKGVTMVWVRKNWKGQGALRQVEQRTAVPILETHEENGKTTAYRIGEGEWVMADQVRVAEPTEPPALVGDRERWFDVDLDKELLVAYEGTLPIYATMVSTGKKETPTPTGIWRMWKKMSEQDMKGLTGEDPYSVATVPWTQFFDPGLGLALHAAYWHDKYGIPRSHGCVNLSPADARWLYFWSEPIVPAGWTMAAGWSEAPGSVVRVRSKADPAPEYRGYAAKVQEARERGDQPVP